MKIGEIKEFLCQNLEILLLSMIPCTIYFKENINSYFLLLYLFYWIYSRRFNRFDKNVLKKLRSYLIFVVLYLTVIGIGNLFSADPASANNFFIKQLTILAFPIFLTHISWTDKNKKLFNDVFLVATLLFLSYLWVDVVLRIIEEGSLYILDPIHPTWKYYLFTSGRLSPDVHPTFLSIYIAYCLFYLVYRRKINQTFKQSTLTYILISILILNLLLLSSRGALTSLILVVFSYEVIKLIFRKNFNAIIRLTLLIVITVFILSDSTIFNRISKVTSYYDKPLIEIAGIDNSTGKRAQVYVIASEIVKDNFWLGIGSNNWNKASKEYYDLYFKNDFNFNINKLNTHNQYLNALINWGILGVFLFGAIIFFPIRFSYNSEHIELFLFWCFFVLVLFTENIFDRHRGIIFYSIISAFTIISFTNKNR